MLYELNGGSMKRVDVAENHAKNNLPLGTVLFFNGYGDYKMAIVENKGIDSRFSGYGASYVCVRLDNYQKSTHQAYTLKHINEKRDNRIAVYWTDERIELEDVLELRDKAREAAELVEKMKKEKDEHVRAVADGLPAKYPYLITVAKSGKGERITATKNIRIELKKAFPSVVFSVTSEVYSGGDSIRINWTDGPTSKQVEEITNKYNEGTFNGMEDIYEYSNSVWCKVFGGAKYVIENRHSSEEAYNKTAVSMGYAEAKFNPKTGQFDGLEYSINEMIKRETWGRAF